MSSIIRNIQLYEAVLKLRLVKFGEFILILTSLFILIIKLLKKQKKKGWFLEMVITFRGHKTMLDLHNIFSIELNEGSVDSEGNIFQELNVYVKGFENSVDASEDIEIYPGIPFELVGGTDIVKVTVGRYLSNDRRANDDFTTLVANYGKTDEATISGVFEAFKLDEE